MSGDCLTQSTSFNLNKTKKSQSSAMMLRPYFKHTNTEHVHKKPIKPKHISESMQFSSNSFLTLENERLIYAHRKVLRAFFAENLDKPIAKDMISRCKNKHSRLRQFWF